ncbi:unnamed protein product, partial [Larinioides sclopetarius]
VCSSSYLFHPRNCNSKRDENFPRMLTIMIKNKIYVFSCNVKRIQRKNEVYQQ